MPLDTEIDTESLAGGLFVGTPSDLKQAVTTEDRGAEQQQTYLPQRAHTRTSEGEEPPGEEAWERRDVWN